MGNSDSTVRHWMVVVGSCLLMVAVAVAISCLSYFIVPVTTDLGYARGEFLIYFTIASLIQVVSMPILGKIFLRVGAVKIIVISGLVTSLGLAGCALSTSLISFYISGAFLGALLPTATFISALYLINLWFEEKKGLVLGITMSFSGIGGAVYSLFLPTFIANNGWRNGYWLLAASVFMLTVPVALLLIRNTPQSVGLKPYGRTDEPIQATRETAATELPGVSYAEALKTPQFYVMYLAILALSFFIIFLQHIPAHFMGVGVEHAGVGRLFMIFMLAMVGAKILCGTLDDKFGTTKTMLIHYGLYLACFVMLIFVKSYLMFAIAMVLFSFGAATGSVLPPLITGKIFGRKDYEGIWGILGTSAPVGMAIGAPIWGWIFDVNNSYSIGFYAAIVCIPLFTIMFIWSIKSSAKLMEKNKMATKPAQ